MNVANNKVKTKAKPGTVAWRYYLVFVVICLIYVGLAARAAYIQVLEPDMLQHQGDLRSLRVSAERVQRGSILDRNGEELAISVPVQTVWADPKQVIAKGGLTKTKHWQALADVLEQDVRKLKARVSDAPSKRFIYLARQVSPTIADYIKQLKIPGIHLRKESKRFYPTGEISAHLVGFTDLDDKGIEGIERRFNEVLTGDDGKMKFRKDAKGRKVEILAKQAATPPKNVVLSIDQRIQAIAYKELKGAVDAFKATSGSVVVTNVHTGEILAMANSPAYNPNNRAHTPLRRFRNRAITDAYEPGSTMKPLTVLTALEFGAVQPDTIVDTNPGWMRIGGRRVDDPINRGKLSLTDILVHSSNMGTTKLALAMPKQILLDKFFQVGFGSETGVELPGESVGMLSSRSRWSDFEIATLSWGYGLAITPVQLASLYSTFANGGVRVPLTILKRETQAESEQVFSSQLTQELLPMLETVVDEHVKQAKVPGYRVGGKTGTSIKAVAGGYGNDYVGLFAGIAPISHPEIVVAVVINEPGGDLYHGADVAAPVFSRVMKSALQILNIAPDAAQQVQLSTNSNKEKQDV